jgi:hypothetical protein
VILGPVRPLTLPRRTSRAQICSPSACGYDASWWRRPVAHRAGRYYARRTPWTGLDLEHDRPRTPAHGPPTKRWFARRSRPHLGPLALVSWLRALDRWSVCGRVATGLSSGTRQPSEASTELGPVPETPIALGQPGRPIIFRDTVEVDERCFVFFTRR